MILDLDRGFCFVHIPRTAGVSISAALMPHLSNNSICDLVQRHIPARRIAGDCWIGDLWSSCLAFRWAVIRHPAEIAASDYRLSMAHVAAYTPEGAARWPPRWRDRIEQLRADASFSAFLGRHYRSGEMVRNGGFWRLYCCGQNGEDLGIEAFRYEDLACTWHVITGRCGIREADAPLRRSNAAPAEIAVRWTAQARRLILDACRDDFQRFGFAREW